jgi:hypothetical protein
MKHIIWLPGLLFLMFSELCLASSFTSTVRQDAAQGYVHLHLTLADAQAQEAPDFTSLENSFRILSQQQSSVQQIVNGQRSSTQEWDLALEPLQSGEVSIPPISIQTDKGTLKTETVIVREQTPTGNPVRNAMTGKSRSSKGIALTARATPEAVYKNETFKLSYDLSSDRSLNNVQIDDLKIADAIVERQGDPQIRHVRKNGRDTLALTANYLVTPLKPGHLQIPALVIHADAQQPIQNLADSDSNEDPFEELFDDRGGDPFSKMRKMMSRFTNGTDLFAGATFQPLSISSRPISIEVRPPMVGISPWLPAKNLKLSESWTKPSANSNDPYIRTVTIQAVGLVPAQIPGVADKLQSTDRYKVYADQPVLDQREVGGELVSSRSERFTIVPTKSGQAVLPQIKIGWWNTKTDREEIATLAPVSLDLVAQPGQLTSTETPALASRAQTAVPAAVEREKSGKSDSSEMRFFSHFAIPAGFAAIFLLALGAIFLRFGRSSNHSEPVTRPPTETLPPKIGKREIEAAESFVGLQKVLQQYAKSNLAASDNLALGRIFQLADKTTADFDKELASRIQREIEESLYSGRAVDTANLKRLKMEIVDLLFAQRNRKALPPLEVGLPHLNPK